MGARTPRMSVKMTNEFDQKVMQPLQKLGIPIQRSPSHSREEILTGVLLAALSERDAHWVAQALVPPPGYGAGLKVEGVYAPSSPIDLVVMLHDQHPRADQSATCRFSICVEIKRFSTNSNWIGGQRLKFLDQHGQIAAAGKRGLWQTDAAYYTKVGQGWREVCEGRCPKYPKYPVRHYVVLAPTQPGTSVKPAEMFPGMHTPSHWSGVSYIEFALSLYKAIAYSKSQAKGRQLQNHSLLPLLALLYPQ